jgi:hypothetical protein
VQVFIFFKKYIYKFHVDVQVASPGSGTQFISEIIIKPVYFLREGPCRFLMPIPTMRWWGL